MRFPNPAIHIEAVHLLPQKRKERTDMGLLKNSAKKLLESALRDAVQNGNVKRKTISCPSCGTRATTTFIGPNDSYTCRKCGYRIYQ